MRMDDYQKWLDAQFLDETDHHSGQAEARSPAIPPTSETLRVPAIPSFLDEAVTSPRQSNSPSDSETREYSAPSAHAEPTTHPAPTGPNEEVDIPTLDRYIPFLRSRSEPAVEPARPAPTREEESEEQATEKVTPPVRADVEEPLRRPLHLVPAAPPHENAARVPALSVEEPTRDLEEPVRSRSLRAPTLMEPTAPLPPERLWSLVPKHLQVLLAMESDDVTQNSYKRQFKESRIELISRLLDPRLSLEDTARLLNVCPTTVRRYTNRGLLTHQRTQGDQRRFKLSDVLAFLEAQSRKES